MSEPRESHIIGRCGGSVAAASFAAILHVLALDHRTSIQVQSLTPFALAFLGGLAVFCCIEVDPGPGWSLGRAGAVVVLGCSSFAFGFALIALLNEVNPRMAWVFRLAALSGGIFIGYAIGGRRPPGDPLRRQPE